MRGVVAQPIGVVVRVATVVRMGCCGCSGVCRCVVVYAGDVVVELLLSRTVCLRGVFGSVGLSVGVGVCWVGLVCRACWYEDLDRQPIYKRASLTQYF